MSEGNCLSQILIQSQRAGDGSGNLGNLKHVGQSCAIVVTTRSEKDLGFLLQAPECLAVDDAVAVALKAGADIVFLVSLCATTALAAEAGIGMEDLLLDRLSLLADGLRSGHAYSPRARR